MNTEFRENIIRVLKYYDYFHYPLSADEVWMNFPERTTPDQIQTQLELMVSEGLIYKLSEFYSIQDKFSLYQRRIEGNLLAGEKLKLANKLTGFISSFPFVKAVFISGSLSKNYADEKTDIDFFICTKANKLWIARTILHLFKKLTFLVGQQHNFCMNYFIDCNHLSIEEQNIYTAKELTTLKSLTKSQENLNYLLSQNQWIEKFLPNIYAEIHPWKNEQPSESGLYKFLFDNFIFNFLNLQLMNITNFKWKKKWEHKGYPMDEYDLAFKTRIYVSKNHPDNYQKKVIENYNRIELHV